MVWRVTTETAGAEYERRHGRSWRVDASLGLFVAMNTVLRASVIRGMVVHGRALEGRRPVKEAAPLPDWCREAMVRYQTRVGAFVRPDTPLVFSSLTNPLYVELADKLVGHIGTVEWEPLEKLALKLLLPAAEKILEGFNVKRRRDETLLGFYAGVRILGHWARAAEVRPSEVALLAAATVSSGSRRRCARPASGGRTASRPGKRRWTRTTGAR